MYAVIETGGKQYRVNEGDVIKVEKLPEEVGAKVSFGRVLLVGEGEKVQVGAPVVSGASVTGSGFQDEAPQELPPQAGSQAGLHRRSHRQDKAGQIDQTAPQGAWR